MNTHIPRLFDQVDNSQLVFFRMAFGFLMAAESWGAIATGWVRRAFIDTEFTFTFIGFEWLRFFHGEMMYGYYIVMGIFGILVMLGFKYRFSMAVLLIMWTVTYLLQKTNYNNHYYLVVLLSSFMLAVPAHRYASLDVKMNPKLQSLTCSRWAVLVLPVQTAIVYFYASVAKIYPDWLRAEPVSIFFKSKSQYFLIGNLLQQEWMAYFVSYGGILFDGLIIPALLWKKTRKVAFVISIFFHLFNSAVFQVGIFPYMMLAITAFFFPVDTVRKLFFRSRPEVDTVPATQPLFNRQKAWILILSLYFIVQVLLPVRHHFYQGNVFWNEEGHRMSWRMMLRSKSGSIDFTVVDHEKKDTLRIDPRKYLSYKQSRAIAARPDMTWQFVQYLKKDLEKQGMEDYSIYANSWARLNKRKSAPLIAPDVDLAKVEWERFRHSEWLTEMPGYE